MQLPERSEIPDATLQQIAERHGFGRRRCRRLTSIGVLNAIYLLGDDLLLRVPRQHPHVIGASAPPDWRKRWGAGMLYS